MTGRGRHSWQHWSFIDTGACPVGQDGTVQSIAMQAGKPPSHVHEVHGSGFQRSPMRYGFPSYRQPNTDEVVSTADVVGPGSKENRSESTK